MSALSKEEFLAKLKERVGDDTSDEALTFMEDMTDTYNALESNQSGTEDWKKKYEDNDAEWRKKYRDRFFSGVEDTPNGDPKPDEPIEDEPKSFEDLFEIKKED